MHDAFGVRLHAGKQAEVCHHHPKMSYMALCLNRAPTFSAKFLFYFSYIDKFSAFGIKICNTFLDDIRLFHGLLDK